MVSALNSVRFLKRNNTNTTQIDPHNRDRRNIAKHFYEAAIILISNHIKTYTPVSFMSIDEKDSIKYWQIESKNPSEKSSTVIKLASS